MEYKSTQISIFFLVNFIHLLALLALIAQVNFFLLLFLNKSYKFLHLNNVISPFDRIFSIQIPRNQGQRGAVKSRILTA